MVGTRMLVVFLETAVNRRRSVWYLLATTYLIGSQCTVVLVSSTRCGGVCSVVRINRVRCGVGVVW